MRGEYGLGAGGVISGEEVANTLTHGVGAVLSLAGLVVLVHRSLWDGSVVHYVCVLLDATSA